MPIIEPPTPPDGIRPAQLGVVLLRRVIIGDLAATLVDLSVRQLLRVDEPEPGRWQLTALHETAPRHRRESLLHYEKTLLHGASRGAAGSLSLLESGTEHALNRTRAELVRDAVHHNWLHHLHHHERTDAGDEMASRIHAFQRGLRHFISEHGEDALPGALLPYALHFAMIHGDGPPLARFARDWVAVFSRLPGWHQPEPRHYDPKDDPVPSNAPMRATGYGWPGGGTGYG